MGDKGANASKLVFTFSISLRMASIGREGNGFLMTGKVATAKNNLLIIITSLFCIVGTVFLNYTCLQISLDVTKKKFIHYFTTHFARCIQFVYLISFFIPG